MPDANYQLDTQGLICPEPIMLLHKTVRKAQSGEVIHVIATDPATTRDIPNFCRHLGHELIEQQDIINPQQHQNPDPYANVYHYWIKKKAGKKTPLILRFQVIYVPSRRAPTSPSQSLTPS